jgi:putative FmdB family regulatory protein
MPTYEYKCESGHVFDVMQRMSDDPLSTCQQCGAPVQRVFHPVAVHFKGSGFYNTDYGTRRRQREAKEASASESAASSNGSSEKSEKKPDASAATSSTPASSSSSSSSSD